MLREPVAARRHWEGTLSGFSGGVITLQPSTGGPWSSNWHWWSGRTSSSTGKSPHIFFGERKSILGTIYQSIQILSKEKGIDPQIVLDAVKDAMLVAARKHYRTEEDLVADLDEETGAIPIFSVKKVVETITDASREFTVDQARRVNPNVEVGGEIRTAMNTDSLGRISAQTAKQVILQKVREAERETIYSEYSAASASW